jgi:uncharacterized protein YcbX
METLDRIEVAFVKGTRASAPATWQVDHAGMLHDRRFVVVDRERRGLSANRSPALSRVETDFADERLVVRFPNAEPVEAPVIAESDCEFLDYASSPRAGTVVGGPFAAAFSRYLRREVELVDAQAWGTRAVDSEPVTLVSNQSVSQLGERLGLPALDPRRFRANLYLDLDHPHQEDEWIGSRVAVGALELEILGPVPRCAVVTRDPLTGDRDADVLREIRRYRGIVPTHDGEKGLPFAVYARVVTGGRVTVGDELRTL